MVTTLGPPAVEGGCGGVTAAEGNIQWSGIAWTTQYQVQMLAAMRSRDMPCFFIALAKC